MVTRSGAGGRSAIGTTGSGNVYAGRDGNVYRNQGGTWQKYNNGGWNSVDRSSATQNQLNRDYSSRMDGARRTQDLGTIRSGSSSGAGRSFNGAGSYRPSGGFSGGGFRGGGGGFRGGGGGRR